MQVGPRRDDGTFVLFDAMRFVAAAMVVLEHTRHVFMLDYDPANPSAITKAFYFVTRFGPEAVLVFFVMSGFWIASVVDRRSHRPEFWREYMIDRCSRLLIVLVPALLLGLALDTIGLNVLHGALYEGRLGAEAFPDNIGPLLRPEVLLGNLLFLQTIAVPTFGTNGALWSLANEFWYYLWFPALFAMIRYRRLGWALLTLGIGVAAPRLLELFPVWLLGAGLYFVHKRGATRRRPGRIAGMAWMVAALVAFAASLVAARFEALAALPGNLLVGFTFTTLLWSLLHRRMTAPDWLRPLARYGAQSSFALYASHYPVLAFAATLLNGDTRLAPTGGAMALTVVVTVLLVACGAAFSRVTEAHTGTLRHWIRQATARHKYA